jgi:hypothetical protein
MGTGYFRTLKVSVLSISLGLIVMTLPQPALAFNLSAKNDTEQPLTFAIMYYDDSMEDWLCRGWFSIPANTTKNFNFPDSGAANSAYLYAQSSGGLIWGARSENEGKASSVIHEKFEYYRGSSTPSGTNQRTVYFKRYNFNDSGNISVRWTGGQG